MWNNPKILKTQNNAVFLIDYTDRFSDTSWKKENQSKQIKKCIDGHTALGRHVKRVFLVIEFYLKS